MMQRGLVEHLDIGEVPGNTVGKIKPHNPPTEPQRDPADVDQERMLEQYMADHPADAGVNPTT